MKKLFVIFFLTGCASQSTVPVIMIPRLNQTENPTPRRESPVVRPETKYDLTIQQWMEYYYSIFFTESDI